MVDRQERYEFGPVPSSGSGGGGGLNTAAGAFVPRMWKATPNSGALGGNAFGNTGSSNVAIGTNVAATSLIDITLGYDTIYTGIGPSAAAGGGFAMWGICDTGSFFVPPPRGAVYKIGTLKLVKWRALIVDTPIANVRIWLAMSDMFGGNRGNLDSDAPVGINMFGFRFSTVAGDVNWQAIAIQNGVGSVIVDTGVAAEVTTGHDFTIVVTSSKLIFYIDGVSVATITTFLPIAATDIGDVAFISNVTLATQKTLGLNEVLLIDY